MSNARPMFKPGDVVRHFKAEWHPDDATMYTYQIVGLAEHTETKEPLVIYTPLYNGGCCGCKKGALYARPAEMFMSEVDREKYPNIKQRFRFELHQPFMGEVKNFFSQEGIDCLNAHSLLLAGRH